jgi:sodium-dependent dicarboxylate transporter 2/3/5
MGESAPHARHEDGPEIAPLTPVRQVMAALGVGSGVALCLAARFGWVAPPQGLGTEGFATLGVLVLMATLWLLEVAPLAATSLLPLVLLPLLGIQSGREVAASYGDPAILLLMGSFFIARALEHWRVADAVGTLVVRRAGGSPLRLLAGLALAAAALSMFMSNTVCALVMGTVALAVVRGGSGSGNAEGTAAYGHAVLLAVAFASSIGGMLTPVGTPPNMILLGQYHKLLHDAEPVAFATWMLCAAPLGVVLLPAMLLVLAPLARRLPKGHRFAAESAGTHALGTAGWRTLAVFGAAVLLWLFRSDLTLGGVTVPGWAGAIGVGRRADDATVAMLGAFVLFALPSGTLAEARARLAARDARAGGFAVAAEWYAERLLTWRVAQQIPWNVLLLFGGGLALGGALESSGVSRWLAGGLSRFGGAPPAAAIAAVALLTATLTQVTSNTAMTTILLPVVAAAGRELGADPHVLMWTVAMAASLAFVLPTATPANAIVQGLGGIPTGRMARAGVLLNALAIVALVAVATWWLPLFWKAG